MHKDKVKKNRPLLSWTAVFAGALIGVGLSFLLNLLSLSLGLSIFSVQTTKTYAFSWGGIIGFMMVAILSMFSCGFISGKLSHRCRQPKIWGVVYGFVAWCLTFIITVSLVMNVIQFNYFHTNFTSNNTIAIRISNEIPMVTETKGLNSETDKKIITLNAYITWGLFMLGALSSCFGGYLGYQPKKQK